MEIYDRVGITLVLLLSPQASQQIFDRIHHQIKVVSIHTVAAVTHKREIYAILTLVYVRQFVGDSLNLLGLLQNLIVKLLSELGELTLSFLVIPSKEIANCISDTGFFRLFNALFLVIFCFCSVIWLIQSLFLVLPRS